MQKGESDLDSLSLGIIELLRQGDSYVSEQIGKILSVSEKTETILRNITTGDEYELVLDLSERARQIILAGGMLNYTANR